MAELAVEFAQEGEPEAKAESPAAVRKTAEPEPPDDPKPPQRKLRRKEIDRLLDHLLAECEPGDRVSTVTATESLESRHPEIVIPRTTVHGALTRFAREGKLQVDDEGGRGGGNVRTYIVPGETQGRL